MKKFQIRSALLWIVIALSLLLSSCDALAAERAVAEEEIRTAQAVKDNPWDGGVAALVEEYASKLASAPDEDAIRAAVSEFGAAVEAHVNAKNSLLAEVQAVDLSSFFSSCDPQHLLEAVLAARDEAVLTVKKASTLAEAEAALASYKAFVLKKMEEQLFGPCDDLDNTPDIEPKYELLEILEGYEARAQLLMYLLTEAYEDGEISEEEYALRMHGKAAENGEEAVFGYEYALGRTNWWQKYVKLAIKTDGIKEAIEEELAPLLVTSVDALADLLADGVPLRPAPYLWDDALQAYVDGVGETETLLRHAEAYLLEAETLFGHRGVSVLLRRYGVDLLTGDALLWQAVDGLRARYATLASARDAAAELISLIHAIDTAEDGARERAIADAWHALDAWAEESGVLSVDPDTRSVVFDRSYEGECEVTPDGGISSSGVVWRTVPFSQAYVVTYFVPNLNALLSAGNTQS